MGIIVNFFYLLYFYYLKASGQTFPPEAFLSDAFWSRESLIASRCVSNDANKERHQTRSNKNDFGEAEMRDWWVEKDYIEFIAEKPIYADESLDDVAEKITVEVNLK